MNHSKVILVACISAFVAITTAFLGVPGTIIGSVLSSVLYNVLSEILEKPVTGKKFNFNFEYEIAYVFPLIIIAFIQLLLLAAFLAQWGYLPGSFLNAYLEIQGVVDNNLYRILGFALIIMGVYPFIIKPNIIKKEYGSIIVFIGLIFLARGFVDAHVALTNLYGIVFRYFDFPIEVFAFILLVVVILLIINNASQVNRVFKKHNQKALNDLELKDINSKKSKYNNNYKKEASYKNSPKNIRVKAPKKPKKYYRKDNSSTKPYLASNNNQNYTSKPVKSVRNPIYTGKEESNFNGENNE